MGGANEESGTPTKTGGQGVTNPPPQQKGGNENDPPVADPKVGQKVDGSGEQTQDR